MYYVPGIGLGTEAAIVNVIVCYSYPHRADTPAGGKDNSKISKGYMLEGDVKGAVKEGKERSSHCTQF